MKLTVLFTALSSVLAGAILVQAAALDHAGPWTELGSKKELTHFKIFAEAPGADLRTAKPVYSKCVMSSEPGRKASFKQFKTYDGFEFQKLGSHTLGVNCIDCPPTKLGHLYQTALYLNCKIQDHRSADWTPKDGKYSLE